ncbi:MAG: SRPBCC family protein [Planctomycetales bacterium]|nr:SRPBCC family protein [Planctomycetales bacterium]
MHLPEIHIERQHRGWELRTEMLLPHEPEQVFPFFADAGNLQQLTPRYLRFKILTPLPIEMHRGAVIDYRLRLHGLPIAWRTEITEWDPPYRFVDSQRKGPYRWWVHEHQFLVDESGGTRVVDCVRYDLPLGRLLHPLFVKRDLRNIFRFRAKVMHEHFIESVAQAASL